MYTIIRRTGSVVKHLGQRLVLSLVAYLVTSRSFLNWLLP